MKTKTRTLTLTAILIAIMLIMGFVPYLGFIILGPVTITLMCIPVIVGTMVLGLRTGVGLGALFAVISIAKMFTMPDAFSALVVGDFGTYGLLYCVCLTLPRLLIPVVTWYIGKAMRAKKTFVNLGVASLAGSLTNTAGYLALVSLTLTPLLCSLYGVDPAGAMVVVWTIVLTNGVPEAIAAMLICPPIISALQKVVPQLKTVKRKEITQ